ncbi:hypothetical protein C8R42DRAFT_644740 [Lentinula raphanica]|nr:hypothetical protein C8R42DRAFT_644740 [Lentinula raphanica]
MNPFILVEAEEDDEEEFESDNEPDYDNLLGLPGNNVDDLKVTVDPLLLGLMEELVQKASEYSLLKVYVVWCEHSSENDIISRIQNDIAHKLFLGQVYLHVHNMNRFNVYLTAYLQRVPGFIYPNRQPISHPTSHKNQRTDIKPDGTSVTAIMSNIPPLWESAHLLMPIHSLIPWHDSPLALNHNLLLLCYQAQQDIVQAGTWVRRVSLEKYFQVFVSFFIVVALNPYISLYHKYQGYLKEVIVNVIDLSLTTLQDNPATCPVLWYPIMLTPLLTPPFQKTRLLHHQDLVQPILALLEAGMVALVDHR